MLRKIWILTMLCLLIIFNTACSHGGYLPNQPSTLKVTVNIPVEQWQKYTTLVEDVALNETTLILKKGNTSLVQTLPVTGSVLLAVFDNLESGEWNLSVVVKDQRGLDVFTNNQSVVILQDNVNLINVHPTLLEGNIKVNLLPPQIGSVTGKITLTNLANAQEVYKENFSGSKPLYFNKLRASEWLMKITFLDANFRPIGEGSAFVYNFPGRTTVLDARLTAVSGPVEIKVQYGQPMAPEDLQGVLSGGNMLLHWKKGPEKNIIGYLVFRSSSSRGKKVQLTPLPIQEDGFTDYNLEMDRSYWYWVEAVNKSGKISEMCSPVVYVLGKAGLVTFILDNGTTNQYERAYPLFQEKKVPAIWAITVNRVNQPNYVTWEQIDEVMQNSFPHWEISSHTYSHLDLTRLSNTELTFELAESKKVLDKYSTVSLTYPYYQVDERVASETGKYYTVGYAGALNGKEFPTATNGGDNEYNINIAEEITSQPAVLKRVTLTYNNGSWAWANWQMLIDSARENDGWLIFAIHDLTDYTQSIVAQIIDYCLKEDVAVGITEDGIRKYITATDSISAFK